MSGRAYSEIVTASADQIYFNVGVLNNTERFIPIKYIEDRPVAVLNNPADYYLSVVRFVLPADTIPIFIFEDNTYSVTLKYGNDTYQKFVVYIPQYATVAGGQTRAVYNYQAMVDMINVAFAAAYADLVAAHPAAVAGPPVMIYDIKSGLFSIAVPQAGYETGYTTSGGVEVWMNWPLYRFFNSFQDYFSFTDDSGFMPDGLDVRIIVKDTADNNLIVNAPGAAANGVYYSTATLNAGPYWLVTQQASSLPYWNDFQKIVFTSGSLPIRQEFLTPLAPDSSSNPMAPVLTDFAPDIANASELRGIYHYIPQAQYRYIDLMSNLPLTRFDVQVFWQGKNGQLYPVYLSPQNSFEMKFLFQRKGTPFQLATSKVEVEANIGAGINRNMRRY